MHVRAQPYYSSRQTKSHLIPILKLHATVCQQNIIFLLCTSQVSLCTPVVCFTTAGKTDLFYFKYSHKEPNYSSDSIQQGTKTFICITWDIQNGNLWVFDPVFRIKRQKRKKWGDGRCTLREQTSMFWAIKTRGWGELSEIKQHKEKNRQNGAGCSDRWREHLFKPWKARWPNSLREV